MKHIQYICKGGHEYRCMFCDGGLFACTVCKGAEGSLPTDCPGIQLESHQADDIYAGVLDYRTDRGWVEPDGSGNSMGDRDINCGR